MEIERKFLISQNIDYLLVNSNGYNIIQAYLPSPIDIRIRKIQNTCKLTVKSDGDIARQEYELDISLSMFYELYSHCTNIINKTRYYIPIDGGTAEVDRYHMELNGLRTVEVEFETLEKANAFIPPDWFGREVTNDKNYKNKNLLQYFKNRLPY